MAFGLVAKSVIENPAIRMLTARAARRKTLVRDHCDRPRRRKRTPRRELLNYYAVSGFNGANCERTRFGSSLRKVVKPSCGCVRLTGKPPAIFPRRFLARRATVVPLRHSERPVSPLPTGENKGNQNIFRETIHLHRNNLETAKGRPRFPELPRLVVGIM